MLLIAGLFVAPVVYAFYLGFTNVQLIGLHATDFSFTGTTNLQRLFTDNQFLRSVILTLVFVVGSGTVGTTVVGLTMALLMQNCAGPVRLLVSSLAIIAWTLPPTTLAVIWFSSSTSGGVIPSLIGHARYDLLYDRPMLVACLANAWSLAGLGMLMFSAALKAISQEMLEAAKLENATVMQRLFRLVLPQLKPAILTSALMMTLLTFGNFTLIYLMTGGGPDNATNILPVYAYLQGFKFHDLAYGALLGDVIVIISAALGAACVFLARSHRSAAY
ncbi:carbohydrate ABC transporter permease [Paraburkholderia sp. EG285A]|uniref:carbohydrate ABC transporter permease n=1 Tax=Paraburkholderia sp. EG285A TaxID=3237009 RepID=UPI0034D1D1F0